MSIDSAILNEFPIFGTYPGLVYLDSAATTQKPYEVLKAMDAYYKNANANIGRGSYALSSISQFEYETSREAVAKFIGCDPDEVVFTFGATDSLNCIARALHQYDPNAIVKINISEHHANILPWRELFPEKNVSFYADLCAVDLVRNASTFIVATNHISNVSGCAESVKIYTQRVHEHPNGIMVLDATQSVPHIKVNVRELGVDVAAFSGHKLYGPMGIGVLYIKRDLMEKLRPSTWGGGMVSAVGMKDTEYLSGPQKFEAGTRNIAGAVGLRKAIQFIEKVGGINAIYEHDQALIQQTIKMLTSLSDRVHIICNGSTHFGLVSFWIDGVSMEDLGASLAEDNIAVRVGKHCAHPYMNYLGIQSCCRISLGMYNTERDIDILESAMKDFLKTA